MNWAGQPNKSKMAIHFPAQGSLETRRRVSLVLPDAACGTVLRALDQTASYLVSLGVSANAITTTCIVLGAVSGVLLSTGQFAWAALAMVIASLGDAVDGLVARRSGSASVGGALLDAAGDRYQEFFFLGGLAIFLRASLGSLVLTLAALAGSFMVSYSSAKAEALGVPVPPGAMRRPERAVCLCLAATLASPWLWLAHRLRFSSSLDALPILIAVGLIAVVANASAVKRLRLLATRSFNTAPRVVRPQAASALGVVEDHVR